MSDIAYKVIINNNGTDDIIFKTIMLKGNNGSNIARIEKTSTSGNVDTYTVYLDDGTVGGTFTVTNSGSSSLSNLTDVILSSLSDGQALVYDNTSGDWKNKDIAQSIADQTDVTLSSLSDGDALVYDSSAGKWKNEALPDELNELGDVDISSAQDGEALLFDSVSGKWKNGTPAQSLAGLTDVDVASAQNGDVLMYNSATGKWEDASIKSLSYHVGDVLSLNNIFAGYISSSSKRVRFTIPLDKPLGSDVTGVNMSGTGDISMYGASGSDSITPVLANWSITLNRGSLFCQYDSSSASSLPNQSGCSVYFSTSGSKIIFT